MSLQRITTDDRLRLIQALEMPINELETNSLLYQFLLELESREDRLGVDLYGLIRADVDEILRIDQEIVLRKVDEPETNLTGFSQSVSGEYSYSQSTSGMGMVAGEQVLLGSAVASLLSAKAKLVKNIKRNLNAYQRQSVVDSYGVDGFSTGYTERSSALLLG